MNKRRILFILGTLAILIAICAVMFVIGRGHTIYLDNKTLEYNGDTYSAMYRIIVSVDGEQVAKLNKRERGQATCIGQTFKMSLAVTQEKDGPTRNLSCTISLPYDMDGIIINLPGLLAGLSQEGYLSEFVSAPPTDTAEEEAPVTDEFEMDSSF